MRMFWPSNVLLEVPPQLLRECKQNLILVIHGVLQERYQLIARAFRAEGESNRRYAMDGVQPQLYIFRPELIHEDGNRGNLNIRQYMSL